MSEQEKERRGPSRTTEQRRDFVAKCVARGLSEYDTIAACQKSGIFTKSNGKIVARRSIREHYLYPVRKEVAQIHLDGPEQIRKTLEALRYTYQCAHEAGRLSDANQSQRLIMKLLGLRANLCEVPNATDIGAQVAAMDLAIAPPEPIGDDDAKVD